VKVTDLLRERVFLVDADPARVPAEDRCRPSSRPPVRTCGGHGQVRDAVRAFRRYTADLSRRLCLNNSEGPQDDYRIRA